MQKQHEFVEEKKALRKKIRLVLKSFWSSCSDKERLRLGEVLADKIKTLQVWHDVQNICIFLSMPDEIDTTALALDALTNSKKVFVPRIRGDDIEFVQITMGWQDWSRDGWNIPEPPDHLSSIPPEMFIKTPTLIVVPGLAFDLSGYRLGRGKGFYDRYLATLDNAAKKLCMSMPCLLGVGIYLQIVESVPAEPHDIKMDILVTVDV